MRYTISRSKAAAYAEQLQLHIGELCNGSTYDSDSYCLGSNPSSPAIMPPWSRGLGRRPLKAKIMGSNPIGGATKQNVLFCFFVVPFFSSFPPLLFLSNRYTEYCIFVRFLFACLFLPFRWNVQAESLILFVFFIMKRIPSDVFSNLDNFFIKCYTTHNVPICGDSSRSVTIF